MTAPSYAAFVSLARRRLTRAVRLSLLVGLGCITGFAALADEDSPSGFTLEFDGGVSVFANSESVGAFPFFSGGDVTIVRQQNRIEFEAGGNVAGAVGYRFNEYLRASYQLSYRVADADTTTTSALVGSANSASVFATLFNLTLDLVPEATLVPFIGAGFGYGLVDVNVKSATNVINDRSHEFAYNAFVGASLPLAVEGLKAVAMYRFFGTTDADLGARYDTDAAGLGLGTLGGDAETEIRAHEFSVGLRYEF